MQLKNYQHKSLKKLARFCDLVRDGIVAGTPYPIHDAYREVCGGEREYLPTPQFPDTPYICLRVPTGGGKTLIAAHAVGTIAKHLGHQDRPLCLWVTPSDPIRTQTLHGLKTRNHPYREALRASLGKEALEVLTIEEALSANRSVLSSAAVVVVTTIQAYRIEDKVGRKIYQDNGYLMDHFRNLPTWLKEELTEPEDGLVHLSLANVLKMRGPIVIMDEAHGARTNNSFESLARFSPLAVLELTATPQKIHDPAREKYASNVLYAASASQLKAEGMIKLPIELESRGDWLEVLARTVELRDDLERRAVKFQAETGRYIRPIALLQAQQKSRTRETHTVDVLKKALIEQLKIPAEYIRISTGDQDDLGKEDLRNEKSSVRYVITVEKLREGWDCPFAYILGSVGNVATETAVEQLLGRVMRMPHAKPTGVTELDRAYAVVQSVDVLETAHRLGDSLVNHCGFDLRTVKDAMQVHRQDDAQGQLPLFWIPVTESVRPRSIPSPLRDKVEYDADMEAIWVRFPLSPQEATLLQNALPEADHPAVEAYVREQHATASRPPKKDVEPLRVPRFVIREGKTCTLFEPTELKEFDWNLDDCSTAVSDKEFSVELDLGNRLEVGLTDVGGVRISPLERILVRQLTFWPDEKYWDKAALVAYLDKNIHLDDTMTGLPKSRSQPWLLRLVDSLMSERKCDLGVLVRKRQDLVKIARTMITDHGREQVRLAMESLVDGRNPNRRLETSMDVAAVLDQQRYAPPQIYDGKLEFGRHAFDLIGNMREEEMFCAGEIDTHPNVGRWIRNLEDEKRGGFFLPLSPDRFFPDFIAELKDGRVAIIEYKGSHRSPLPGEQHKKKVGELWADRSEGRCVFAWVVDKDWSALNESLNQKQHHRD